MNVRKRIPTKQISCEHLRVSLAVTRPKLGESVQNFEENVVSNNFYILLSKIQNFYFQPNNFKLIFLEKRFREFVYGFSDRITFLK